MAATSAEPVGAAAQQSPKSTPPIVYEPVSMTSARSLKQMSYCATGAVCFLLSAAYTRRAIHTRYLRLKPQYYSPNTQPHEYFNPTQDAIEALRIATMNVASLGLMVGGGTLWAFDISGLSEMQTILRSRLGYGDPTKPAEETDKAGK